MVPKTRADGAGSDHHLQGDAPDTLAGEAGELAEEIAADPFFQRTYSFPQVDEAAREEASSSSPDGSSDTEGPLSPTHMKARQTSLAADTLPSPQSPAPSVAVGSSKVDHGPEL